jgi:SWIM zinc finger
VPLEIARIEQIAPDQGSLDAARKLLKPAQWPSLGHDGDGYLWGECQGSGATPYRVIACEADLGHKCTCPSRKFPCKHALALLWMRAAGGAGFAPGVRPQWVEDWIGRRRGPGEPKSKPAAAEAAPQAFVAAVGEAGETAPDPKAEARAQAQRERLQAAREESIRNGLDELDQWIADQLGRGLAGFPADAVARCRTLARRLVDAKAGGLANRVDEIPQVLFGLPDAQRGDYLIQAFGRLHLAAEAYRRQDALPALLRADVRQFVGWSPTREQLLADAKAPRAHGRWMALACVNEAQPDKLRRLETWLARLDRDAGPEFAVLIDFAPITGGMAASPYAPGDVIDAELVFHPAPAPLRAAIARQNGAAAVGARWPSPPRDLAACLARYDEALAARPLIGAWPLAIRNASLRRTDEGLWISDAGGGPGLPALGDEAAPLADVEPFDAFGLWDGRCFAIKFAETQIGRWTCR